MSTEKDNFLYILGYRDGMAAILAETKDKVKLKEQAEFYSTKFEKHFSHDWHVNP